MNISENEIHIWYTYNESIHTSFISNCYSNIISKQEKLQRDNFHFEKHRRQYLITRVLVRSVLSLYAHNVMPKHWEFHKNKYGKPFIYYPSLTIPLYFNISHTEQIIVMVVCLRKDIGIDTEQSSKTYEIIEMAKTFFSQSETEELLTLPTLKQKNRFIDLWTLKEAYIKACGMGLFIPLNEFSYSFPCAREIAISFGLQINDYAENWQFWLIQAERKHKVAVAIKNTHKQKVSNIIMHEVVPLWEMNEVQYPILMKST